MIGPDKVIYLTNIARYATKNINGHEVCRETFEGWCVDGSPVLGLTETIKRVWETPIETDELTEAHVTASPVPVVPPEMPADFNPLTDYPSP